MVFRWTIDDKQSLTFHNVVFNVIYQSAAVFKLSVGRGKGAGRGRGCGGVSSAHSCLLSQFCLAPYDPTVARAECGAHSALRPIGGLIAANCLHS